MAQTCETRAWHRHSDNSRGLPLDESREIDLDEIRLTSLEETVNGNNQRQ